jgi:AraC-like DNA-binding protein
MSASSVLDADQKPGGLGKLPVAGPIPFVRANALSPFVGFLDSIGSPVDRLLQQAGVPVSLLDDSEALLPVFSGYPFIEQAARHEHLENIGVLVGQRASAFELGAYGAALQGTSTVYEYLRLGVQLIGAHSSGTRLWLEPEKTALRVNQYLTGPPSLGRCIADLYTLVLTISTLRQFFGPAWSPDEVRLLAGDEVLLDDGAVFAGTRLITGQRHSSFTFPLALAQRVVPRPRNGMPPGQPARPAPGPPIPADFRASAEHLVVMLLGNGCPGIHSAAEATGMSPRTLQRRLAGGGMTYAGLVAASRLRVAKDWLIETDMGIAEIAAALGYSAASNFARAFRRQTGVSPSAFRRGVAKT